MSGRTYTNMGMGMERTIQEINELVRQEAVFVQDLLAEINKVIVGQERLIQRLLIGMLADGHVLIEGVPGLAKTLMIRTLAPIAERLESVPTSLMCSQ